MRFQKIGITHIREDHHDDEGRMEGFITLAARWISFDNDVKDVRDRLIKEGASEQEAYLAYCAAQIYVRE